MACCQHGAVLRRACTAEVGGCARPSQLERSATVGDQPLLFGKRGLPDLPTRGLVLLRFD